MKSTDPTTILLHTGAVIEATIFATEKSTTTQQQAPAISATAKLLIDTGANISGLDKKIIQHTGLIAYPSSELVDGVGGLQVVSRYKAYLQIPSVNSNLMSIDLLEGDFCYSPYDGVIGRDVLQYFHFEYDGINNRFLLSAKATR